ncbi:Cerato-platanin [Rhizopogon vinicolor AM-OR11-026]|uniref:Cerato-platanin n=1 Tax=Rhizopogon vinicolor AM-OR11-026 TaxID=1314800 RepID=A0A1B7N7Z3_9AGAM|nr:Cerato-platanin [Rhizopogon vinicolor AM-OR11-026]
MKLSSAIALVSAFALPTFATQYNVTYDTFYDNPTTSLSQVACSNGVNGLLTKGYTTFNSLPSFPDIGGIPDLVWNSTLCGTCWQLEYTTPSGQYKSIYFTAVDAAYTINLSQEAFNVLTDNTGVASGKVTAVGTQVAPSFCDM